MVPRMRLLALLLASTTWPSIAHAEGSDLAADAAFTPGVLRAHDGDNTGFVVAATEFNGASDRVRLDVLGEVRVYGRVRAIAKVADAFRDVARPGGGIAVQWLDERRHGVAATAYVFFKTEGFSEPEGELEVTLAFGRRLGPIRAVADVAYGQDPEGKDRDAELAFAAHVEPRHNLFAGVVARYRDALGSRGEAGVLRDGFGGATATLATGRVAVTAQAGVGLVGTAMAGTTVGPAATIAVGASF